MNRPKGMPKWKWDKRNDPPSREEQAKASGDRLLEMKAAGVEWVEWVLAGTGDECRHCREMGGRVMRIDDVPFVEHPDCQHEDGCRCLLIAVSQPKDPK